MTAPAPSLEDALGWLRGGHIAPDPGLAVDPQLARNAELVAAVFRVYPDFAELILSLSLRRPPVDHRLSGEEYLRFAQLREGQNQLATALLTYVEHHERIRNGRRPQPATELGPQHPAGGPGGGQPAEQPWSPEGPGLAYGG